MLTPTELAFLTRGCDAIRAERGLPDEVMFSLLDDMARLWTSSKHRCCPVCEQPYLHRRCAA